MLAWTYVLYAFMSNPKVPGWAMGPCFGPFRATPWAASDYRCCALAGGVSVTSCTCHGILSWFRMTSLGLTVQGPAPDLKKTGDVEFDSWSVTGS